MKVTVVIPNYNGKHFLKDCLTSLRNQEQRDFHTLLIDNGSTDGSVEYIEQEFPEFEVVKCDKNYGFTGAVNMGIRLTKTPYILLLNNDTEVDSHFVKELELSMDRHPKAFSVSSKMLNFQQRELMDDGGDMYSLVGWQFQRGVGRKESDFTRERKVFSACAGAAIYRKEVFDRIGGFDETHFAYLEDMDVGYRARLYGYENWFCPEAKVYHVGSGTTGSKYNDFKVRLSARNSVYMNVKNMPLLQLAINLIPLAVGHFVKWLFFVRKGFGKTYALGIWEGIRRIGKCKKVPFAFSRIWNYIEIEWELICNCFLYLYEFVKRHS